MSIEHNEITELKKEVARLSDLVARMNNRGPVIKPTTHIGAGVKLAPNISLWSSENAPISIGSYTNIFRNAEINGPVSIGEGCLLNRDAYVRSNTTIGNKVFVGPFVRFITDSHELAGSKKRAGKPTFKPIVIGDGCWIGASSTILGGVTIGAGSVIAAGSVVNKDIPENTLVGGVPAQRIRTLPANNVILEPSDSVKQEKA